MGIIFSYLFLGFVFALLNIDYSEKYFSDATYNEEKTKRLVKSIKNIVVFNNIKTISIRISVGITYILFFPLMFLIKAISRTNYKYIISFFPPISISILLFKFLGELPAFKSRIRTDKAGNRFQTIYTLNGKMKFYMNEKLHNSNKTWAIKEDNYISAAIQNVPFYYKNGKPQKFNFNHEERYFINGKEVNKMLHSECMRIMFGHKINNF